MKPSFETVIGVVLLAIGLIAPRYLPHQILLRLVWSALIILGAGFVAFASIRALIRFIKKQRELITGDPMVLGPTKKKPSFMLYAPELILTSIALVVLVLAEWKFASRHPLMLFLLKIFRWGATAAWVFVLIRGVRLSRRARLHKRQATLPPLWKPKDD